MSPFIYFEVAKMSTFETLLMLSLPITLVIVLGGIEIICQHYGYTFLGL